ncbi:MAG: lamin tail domain-containing protein [Methanoregula sp.]|jgi:beta-lactamase superfamily II metal-dependent hydrolase
MYRKYPKKAGLRHDLHRSVATLLLIFILVSCIAFSGCLSDLGIPDFGPGGSPHLADNDGKLSAYFLDVGQGDSSLIIFGNKTILIDAGEVDMGGRVVSDLRELGVTRIDLLVATHPHSDHIGGMQKVLDNFPVGQVLDSGMPHSSALYERFLETIDKKNIPYKVAVQGDEIDLDPALRILVLSPPEKRFGDDLNTNSIMLRISYGTINFLFTGDAGGEAETALVKSGYALDAQILKVGHHGSMYSSSPAFIARVHPETAFISLGQDNPYGHPHKQAIDTLTQASATIYRTDRNGTILVRSDGTSYAVKTAMGVGGLTPVLTTSPQAAGTTLPVLPPLPPLPSEVTNSSIPQPSIPVPQIGNATAVVISATQFNSPGDDRQNVNGEWVQLTNRGDDTVLIAGWTLSDNSHSTVYTFPAIVLVPGETITVFSGAGTLNNTALYMGKTEPVWGNSGDIAILKGGSGKIIDQKSEGTKA